MPAGLREPEITGSYLRERLLNIESDSKRRIDDLQRQINDLGRQNSDLFDELIRLQEEGFSETIIRAKREQMERSWHEQIKLTDEFTALRKNMREKFLDALSAEEPSKFTAIHKSKVSKDRRAIWERGTETFRRLVGIPTIDDEEIHLQAGGKGRSHCWQRVVSLTTSAGDSTVVHELGHALEFLDPEVHRRAVEFLKSRTKGETAKWLGDHFAKHEVTKKDKFIRPYMGKIYLRGEEHYATEIVSMGLEMLFTNPVELARGDPEYFDFMIKLLGARR